MAAAGAADPSAIVDCLLPGQVRRLGTRLTYVARRPLIRTTAEDCAIRGGEYVLEDSASYGAALEGWRAKADAGDAEAQYYVGSIYEKGKVGAPDYALAAAYYRKAAEQGYTQAAVSLGRLYEKGLGVPQNKAEAFNWYAKASGVSPSPAGLVIGAEKQARTRDLETRVREQDRTINRLREQLNKAMDELTRLRSRQGTEADAATQERQQLAELGAKYRAALAELAEARAKPEPDVASRHEEQVEALRQQLETQRQNLEQRDREIARRTAEIAQLNERITELSEELDDVVQPQARGIGDFGGPTIELIDPPAAAGQDEVRIASTTEARPVTGRVLASGGLKSLSVNGKGMRVGAEGTFTVLLPEISAPGTRLEILAIDHQGKRSMRAITLLPADGGVASVPRGRAERGRFGQYYALVVGNDNYRHWERLRNAVNDARAIAGILRDRYGFQVTLLTDATRQQILKALNDLRQRLTERDNLLIYYAGHGHLEEKIDRGYWIPVDAERDDPTEWISTFSITDHLQLMSAKHVMVVADSCYAGMLTRNSYVKLEPGLSEEARTEVLETLAAMRARVALTSGGVKPVLDAGGKGHSVFAQAFLGVLADNGIILEAERLYLAIRARVVTAAARRRFPQVPSFEPINFAGHEGGDFIFVPQVAG